MSTSVNDVKKKKKHGSRPEDQYFRGIIRSPAVDQLVEEARAVERRESEWKDQRHFTVMRHIRALLQHLCREEHPSIPSKIEGLTNAQRQVDVKTAAALRNWIERKDAPWRPAPGDRRAQHYGMAFNYDTRNVHRSGVTPIESHPI